MNSEIEKETVITNDPEFISPKIDYAFKQMMNSKIALKNFLSTVLKIEEKNIDDIQYIDTHTLKEYDDDKYVVMDVRLLLKDKCEIDIEMQVMSFKHWTDRVVYYSSRMLSEQMKRGQDYGKFIKCVSISILDFNIFDKNSYPGYYSSYHIREDSDGRIFADLLEFHLIELPKISKILTINSEDDLLIWAKFINSKNREEMVKLTEKNEGIKAAYDELLSLENDDERRQIYRIREKAIMDYKVQTRLMREEGRQEEKLQTAKNMLKKGLSIEIINDITELSIEKIKELQKEINEEVN
jgi:predicted transposase/invertase (TIGR01784 family)